MIQLWYCNTSDISEKEYVLELDKMPVVLREKIESFYDLKIRKLSLYGKVLVEHFYKELGKDFSWDNFVISPSGKPFMGEGIKFSISHSGTFVFVAFSDLEIGVDAEEVIPIEVKDIQSQLPKTEQEYLKKNEWELDAFYFLWTRKEALLKATGEGLSGRTNGEFLNSTTIRGKSIWHITSRDYLDYKVSICTPYKHSDRVSLREWRTTNDY